MARGTVAQCRPRRMRVALTITEHSLGLVGYLLIELSIAPGEAFNDEGRWIEIDAILVSAFMHLD